MLHRPPWASIAAIVGYLALLAGLGFASFHANGRHLVYALDDGYIHMAMASHLVRDGVFGVTPFEFSSSTSSPLWTLLLAGWYALFGISDWAPLLLNALAGCGVLLALGGFARAAGLPPRRVGLLLVACVVLVPLAPLSMTGMEHLVHLLAIVLLLHALWRLLADESSVAARALIPFGLAVAFAVAIRFETLFVVLAACLALAYRRRWSSIPVALVCALVPVAIVGVIGVVHGQHFLPSTLLLKGQIPRLEGSRRVLESLDGASFGPLVRSPYLAAPALALAALAIARLRLSRRDPPGLLALVVLIAMLLHLRFADTGSFYRYEAYLVALALTALALAMSLEWDRERRPLGAARIVVGLAALLALAPLAARARLAHLRTVPATENIDQQQIQMGRFLHRFYEAQAVAANDIGAIDWLARLRCLDLRGLACREVLDARIAGTYGTEDIRRIAKARGVRIAVAYPAWFRGRTAFPEEWTMVGTWRIPHNVVCYSDTVAFLGTSRGEAARLAQNLRAFARELPPEVSCALRGAEGPAVSPRPGP